MSSSNSLVKSIKSSSAKVSAVTRLSVVVDSDGFISSDGSSRMVISYFLISVIFCSNKLGSTEAGVQPQTHYFAPSLSND